MFGELGPGRDEGLALDRSLELSERAPCFNLQVVTILNIHIEANAVGARTVLSYTINHSNLALVTCIIILTLFFILTSIFNYFYLPYNKYFLNLIIPYIKK